MSSTNIISVAVLPFRNLSSIQENEFFCDGMTEEIINALSKIDQLKVTSRISSFYFKDHQASLTEIAEKLGVKIILEGSVRVASNALRIQAQLIDVAEDTPFWIETWDRRMENLFEIQDEVSLLIADKLREHEGHLSFSDHLVESPTKNLSAYEHFLKGQYHFNKWNPEDSNIAIQEYEKALDLDPDLIDALVGIADSYSFLAVAGFAPREESWMKAADALQRAKALDPNHARLNLMLSNQAFFTEADFASAVLLAEKSVATKPTYAEGHQFLSFYHTLKGDFKKAREHILYAKSIDPLNPETHFFEANYYYRNNELEKALEILNDLLQDNDKNLPALVVTAYIHIKKIQLDEAKTLIERTPQEAFTPDERLALLTLIEILNGNQNTEMLTELEEHGQEPTAHHAHSYLFIIYAILGRNDKAFETLEQLFQSKSSILLLGFSDPLSEPIKADYRYPEYHERIYPRIDGQAKIKKTKIKSPDDATSKSQLKKLSSFVEAESPFLNPSLSLRSLAEQIDIHPNQLSWLLNEFIGKNFNEYINHERIEHFKKLVVDPSNSHISLIGLAYESGFNSKTVFNTAFKKATGLTPKEYQKSHS